MTRQSISVSTQVFRGKASGGNYQGGKPGTEVTLPYLFEEAPALAVANAYCTTQAQATVGASLLFNGTLAGTSGGGANQVSAGVADVARNVVAAWTGAAVLTVLGLDINGNTQSEASASGTSFTGKKAFSVITSVTFSAAVTAATVGTGSKIGLPNPITGNHVLYSKFNNAADAGTITGADTTSPPTTTTGDTRGTYTPAGTLDGATLLAIAYFPTGTDGSLTLFGLPNA